MFDASMKTQLQPGDPAPDFTATAVGGSFGEGQSISLSGLRGKKVVLYFYPKDDTPGCTAQACGVRDRHAEILAKDAVIFGVSIDSPKSHAKFAAKHSLPFPLLSDESRALVEAYGVWVEKSMYGKKYMGTERTTFVIDPEGKSQAVHRKISPAAHMDAVLKSL
jgi:peroxiredoxin Q/BCP